MANETTPLNEQEAEQAGQEKTETEVIKVHDRARGGYKDNVFGTTTPRGKPSPHAVPFRLNGGNGGGGENNGGENNGGENNGGGE